MCRMSDVSDVCPVGCVSCRMCVLPDVCPVGCLSCLISPAGCVSCQMYLLSDVTPVECLSFPMNSSSYVPPRLPPPYHSIPVPNSTATLYIGMMPRRAAEISDQEHICLAEGDIGLCQSHMGLRGHTGCSLISLA